MLSDLALVSHPHPIRLLAFPLPLLHSSLTPLLLSFFVLCILYKMFHPSDLPVALVTSNKTKNFLIHPFVQRPFDILLSLLFPPSSSFSTSSFSLKRPRLVSCYACPPLHDFPSIPRTSYYPPPLFSDNLSLSTYRYYPLCHAFFLSIIYPSCTIYFFHTVWHGASSINQPRPTISYGLLPRSRR
jgi:hypothetical protein